MKLKERIFTVLLLSALCTGLLFAQADRATITGTVTDNTGAVLPDAPVVATNTKMGTTFSASTNGVGIYTISNLPIGTYTLEVNHAGFKDYKHTDISVLAAQVVQINVRMAVGAAVETVTVTGTPLLETETSSVTMTMEEDAIRELPQNAAGGREALNLMIATVPTMSGEFSGQSFVSINGGQTMSSSIYIDGVDATAGYQGQAGPSTPGQDAIQQMQVATTSTDAEVAGTSGGSVMVELKSGTNKFHGSAFYFMQNEALDSNGWSANYFLAQCAANDTTCKQQNGRQRYRFNDYGFSAGGPIRKNRAFIFGDYENFSQDDLRMNANSQTVPTPQMLAGDFSQMLTGGTSVGAIPDANGNPWINPCTGDAYQYGQIFDPATQQQINGVTCATPFPGNVIPSGRISAISQKVAAIFNKYYKPTLDSRIYNNFPSLLNSWPISRKRSIDTKFDYVFSDRNHFSASFNYERGMGTGMNGGFGTLDGPLSSMFDSSGNGYMIRLVDNYSITSTITNTLAAGYSRDPGVQPPHNPVNNLADYGFPSVGGPSHDFPLLYLTGTNGIGYPFYGDQVDIYYMLNAFHYQDTVAMQKGRHNIKFGGELTDQQMNSGNGGNQLSYNFASDTGGPIDPSLTSYLGSGLSSLMLGDVQSTYVSIENHAYPRQKTFDLFAVDDIKVNSKLTLNTGLRWDVTLPFHEAAGHLANFNVNAQNPLWAPYTGAWAFGQNAGSSFATNNDFEQLGPHVGASYQLTNKLVARASYGLFYVPLGTFGLNPLPYTPQTQTQMFYPISQVVNTNEGTTAYNWDGGYPGSVVYSPRNSTATGFGGFNFATYCHPDFDHLGRSQNLYAGVEYEMAKNVVLDVRYMGNMASNLHDSGRSLRKNYPNYGTYSTLLQSGNFYNWIASAGDAASAGIPYPYPGFSGPAYAAISPYPQVVAAGATLFSFGDPADAAMAHTNSFIVEMKVRNSHGLYVDYSWTLSRQTGNNFSGSNFSSDWGNGFQDMDDFRRTDFLINSGQTAKGYVTYALPVGKNQRWLSGSSKLLDAAVGGWTVGYYGSYGNGAPMGAIYSAYGAPNYLGNARANFANGVNASNVKSHFGGHLDLLNLMDPSNNFFNPAQFTSTSQQAPFGNSPMTYSKWRWNGGSSNENISLVKHFPFGPDRRFTGSLRAELYNAFNRHYFSGPSTGIGSPNFGQITGVYGNRYGQLGARLEW